ncbi:hypothetical protein HMPREF3048_10575 [Corynebacterium sp. HMSC075D04]|uniref:hypothetical protein n=1 Tax=Corynebacterium sp. HMSC075D04 TaxID=1739540 RepID=UPI0008A221A9|nr:hypothetical protein [Corynebacterium sp. HMSC075D04]OFO33581.1 hypothetical protein HMPREF3048_10575 [Corynebacterium sp. HMSC075D04]
MIIKGLKASDCVTPDLIAGLTEAERAILFMDVVVAAAEGGEWTDADTLRIRSRDGFAVAPSAMLSATRAAMLTDLDGYVALHRGEVTVDSTITLLTWSAGDLLQRGVLDRMQREGWVREDDTPHVPGTSRHVKDREDTVVRLRRVIDAGWDYGVYTSLNGKYGAEETLQLWRGRGGDVSHASQWRPVCVRDRLAAYSADALERTMQRWLVTGKDLVADAADAPFKDAMTHALHMVHGTDPDARAVWRGAWLMIKRGIIPPPDGTTVDDLAQRWGVHHDLWGRAVGLTVVGSERAWGYGRQHRTTYPEDVATYAAVNTHTIVDCITPGRN